MKYVIFPSIAACVEVVCPHFASVFIFLSEEEGVVKGIGDRVEFEELPLKVRAAINKHFGTVFALPVEQRGEYLKNLEPMEVDDDH